MVMYLSRSERWRVEAEAGCRWADLVPALSRVAMLSVGTLVLSGAFASWLHVPGLSAL